MTWKTDHVTGTPSDPNTSLLIVSRHCRKLLQYSIAGDRDRNAVSESIPPQATIKLRMEVEEQRVALGSCQEDVLVMAGATK